MIAPNQRTRAIQRKLVTRYEHKAANFLGFVQLACAAILLRRL
jgi:transposase